ncbi:MAG: hypothetical protein NUW01_19725 [Gemmatimonadaceae bacterium]|nr:hypothetical protein [Gemmatimonadaceae bacterium]
MVAIMAGGVLERAGAGEREEASVMNTIETEREAIRSVLLDLARTCFSAEEAWKMAARWRGLARMYDDAATEAVKRAEEINQANEARPPLFKDCHPI